jgi:MFS family permease
MALFHWRRGTRAGLRRAFASLEVPNYRWFFTGQLISISGSYIGGFAEIWLLVELTGSGLWVSLAGALFASPLLLGGAWGGVLADRVPKRRLLLITQAAWMLNELALWGVCATHIVQPWMVCAAIAARGSVNAVDLPASASFLSELVGQPGVANAVVGQPGVANAVALKTLSSQVGLFIGSAMAGVVIVRWGVAECLAVSAISCAVLLAALAAIDVKALHRPPPAKRESRQLRQGLRHVRARPDLWIPLATLGIVGTLSLNLTVLVPLLALETHGSAATYAVLSIAVGAGSVGGALAAGVCRRVGPVMIVASAAGVGVLELFASQAGALLWQVVTLAAVGALSAIFTTAIDAHLLHTAVQTMQGRVMALYGIGLIGSATIGGPLAGWLTDTWSARTALLVGGLAALFAAVTATGAFGRSHAYRSQPGR